MINLARLTDQVQTLFDDLGRLSIDAGMRRALEVYDRVLAFHTSVDGGFEAIERLGHESPRDRHGEDYTHSLVSFTIYGMYLQVKTLCLLPLLQVSVWQALGRDNLQAGMETGLFIDGLADECVKTACDTIRMFERHVEVYPHIPEVRTGTLALNFVNETDPHSLPSSRSRPSSCSMPSRSSTWTCSASPALSRRGVTPITSVRH